MNLNSKLLSWSMLGFQGAMILWLNIRSPLDPFSQIILVPLTLLAGVALLTIQQRGD